MPFLGVQGFMVTRYANTHGVATLAKDLVASYIMLPASQRALAAANGRYPANTVAGKQVNNPVLAQFGRGRRGRRSDAEHPADVERVGGARRGLAEVDERDVDRCAPTFTTAARNIRNKIG